MALNWVMLDESGTRPVPLPDEAFVHSVRDAAITLEFDGSTQLYLKATGTVFATSHRIIFVRQAPPSASRPDPASANLQTLSIPHDRFQNFRYVIPIFSAAYLEADVYPVLDGGLPQRRPGEALVPKGKLKIWFNEGGGVVFRDAVEKARKAWEQLQANRADEDALRECIKSQPDRLRDGLGKQRRSLCLPLGNGTPTAAYEPPTYQG
ncbi:hypothetical protein ACQY0O_001920 [Thecaphora frezii]